MSIYSLSQDGIGHAAVTKVLPNLGGLIQHFLSCSCCNALYGSIGLSAHHGHMVTQDNRGSLSHAFMTIKVLGREGISLAFLASLANTNHMAQTYFKWS